MKLKKEVLNIENEESEPSSTLDLAHIKSFRTTIEIIGSWPHKELGTTKLSRFFTNNTVLFFISLMKLIAEVAYLKMSFGVKSFEMLGHVYITVLVNITAVTRIILPWQRKYRDLFRTFLQEFHIFHYRNHSDYARKTYIKLSNACEFFIKLLCWETACGLTTFNLTPLIRNYRSGMFSANKPINGTYELSVYFAFPYDCTTNFQGYVIVSILNVGLSTLSSIILCFYDLILILAAVNVWGHMKIMVDNLKNFPRPAMKCIDYSCPWYSEEESRNVTSRLIHIIGHHRIINRFSERISDVFGPMLFFYHVILQVSGCIVLFQLSTLDVEAIAKYGMVALILFQELILLSVVFEQINSVSDIIINEVYGLPWEYMNTKNRKIVLFFLRNVQVPVNVKAMGLIPVGVETMASVLKTSISYCVMLRTFAYK